LLAVVEESGSVLVMKKPDTRKPRRESQVRESQVRESVHICERKQYQHSSAPN
jgi:hypothetical protein